MKTCVSNMSKRKVSYIVVRDLLVAALIVALPWFVIYNAAIHNFIV
jgi:hypothetical protein